MAKKKNTKKSKKKPIPKKEEQVINVYAEAISFAAEAFRSGKSENYVAELLSSAYKLFTPENIAFIIGRGSAEIALQHSKDRQSIISLHVRRYNQEIERAWSDLNKVEEEKVAPHIRRKKKIDLLDNIVTILFAKERVLQLHGKDTQIKVFNKLNAKIRDRKVGYDISALTFDQKLDFLKLVLKCKKTSNELFSIQLRAQQDIVKTEDADFEVVENDNIDKIKKTNIPALPEPPHPIDIQKEQSLSPMDVMAKIHEALKKKAAEEFKKKGAKHV